MAAGISTIVLVVDVFVVSAVPGCLLGDAAAHFRLVIYRTRKVVNAHGVSHMSNFVQSKVAGDSHPLVYGRSSENYVFVPFIVHRLPDVLKVVTSFVQDRQDSGRVPPSC